jgi:hypothetical protein
MSPQNAERPATELPVNGPSNASSLGRGDSSSNIRTPAAVQGAFAYLKREFIAEALRIAAIKASHGADNVAIGDDLNAERDIVVAIQNLREAGRAFRELQAMERAQ